MALFNRKESALDRRLKTLDKELASVQGRLRSAMRGAITRQKTAPSAPQPELEQQRQKEPLSEQKDAPAQQAPPQPDNLFPHLKQAKSEAQAHSPAEPDLFSPPSRDGEDESRTERRRFANYFMAGHFQDLRPMRQGRNVQRNRAIVTIIAALFAAAWLLYWIFW